MLFDSILDKEPTHCDLWSLAGSNTQVIQNWLVHVTSLRYRPHSELQQGYRPCQRLAAEHPSRVVTESPPVFCCAVEPTDPRIHPAVASVPHQQGLVDSFRQNQNEERKQCF